jgi:hypothetical protein
MTAGTKVPAVSLWGFGHFARLAQSLNFARLSLRFGATFIYYQQARIKQTGNKGHGAQS